jgi:hypothetical protein
MTRAFLLALAGPFMAAALTATAEAQSMPPPPSMNDPAPAAGEAQKKPAPKAKRPAKPADAAAEAAKPAPKAAAQRGSVETRPLSRKVDPRDIDDPYGGVGPRDDRVAPTFTPGNRVGVGGRF